MGTALAAVAVAVLAAGELMGRLLASTSEEPLRWHDRFTQVKELQMRRLHRRGGADVVLLGSSKVLLGLDPCAIGEITGLTTYNASIYRGLPGLSEAWLQDRVLPLLSPTFVLIGISPSEVNDNTPLNDQLRLYRTSPVLTAGPLDALRHRVGHYSAAVRFAPMLKQPRALKRALVQGLGQPARWRWRPAAEIDGVLGPEGQGLAYLDREYGNGPRMRELYGQLAGDYADDGVQSDALRRMVEHNRRVGARTVFVAMPGSREYIEEMFVGGRPAWEGRWQALQRLVADTGCALIDVTEGLEDHRFYADMLHLNRTGRDAFSARVAQELATLLSRMSDQSQPGDSRG